MYGFQNFRQLARSRAITQNFDESFVDAVFVNYRYPTLHHDISEYLNPTFDRSNVFDDVFGFAHAESLSFRVRRGVFEDQEMF
jgi:hypothetical protein